MNPGTVQSHLGYAHANQSNNRSLVPKRKYGLQTGFLAKHSTYHDREGFLLHADPADLDSALENNTPHLYHNLHLFTDAGWFHSEPKV